MRPRKWEPYIHKILTLASCSKINYDSMTKKGQTHKPKKVRVFSRESVKIKLVTIWHLRRSSTIFCKIELLRALCAKVGTMKSLLPNQPLINSWVVKQDFRDQIPHWNSSGTFLINSIRSNRFREPILAKLMTFTKSLTWIRHYCTSLVSIKQRSRYNDAILWTFSMALKTWINSQQERNFKISKKKLTTGLTR